MCMMNNKVDFDMDMAVEALMAIIEREPKAKKIEAQPEGQMITYDGYGTVIEIDGVKTHTGKKKKRAKRVRNGKEILRDELNEACLSFLQNTVAFGGKVYTNTKDGIIIRMADADYTVKAGGHATCEFDIEAEDFRPVKSFATRGSAVNHSSAIAKMLTAEIENQNPDSSFANFGNENLKIVVCSAKASGIGVQISGAEFTIKISKKRARCIVDIG